MLGCAQWVLLGELQLRANPPQLLAVSPPPPLITHALLQRTCTSQR